MIPQSFTFDSTQDISRDPIIVSARKRHFEMERVHKEIYDHFEQLMRDGYYELASTFLSCSLTAYRMRFF